MALLDILTDVSDRRGILELPAGSETGILADIQEARGAAGLRPLMEQVDNTPQAILVIGVS
jgi:hypothetical protein